LVHESIYHPHRRTLLVFLVFYLRLGCLLIVLNQPTNKQRAAGIEKPAAFFIFKITFP